MAWTYGNPNPWRPTTPGRDPVNPGGPMTSFRPGGFQDPRDQRGAAPPSSLQPILTDGSAGQMMAALPPWLLQPMRDPGMPTIPGGVPAGGGGGGLSDPTGGNRRAALLQNLLGQALNGGSVGFQAGQIGPGVIQEFLRRLNMNNMRTGGDSRGYANSDRGGPRGGLF